MAKIKTNTLRIGNIIDFNGRLFKVREIYENAILGTNIYDDSDSGTIHDEDIKGVPITEELLNMLGWHKEERNTFKLDKGKAPLSYIEGHLDIEYPYDESGIRVWMYLKEGYGTAVYLKYLHELQNLFQALHFTEI